MNYSKQYISEIGKKTGFLNSNIEKVIRLLDVLCFIHYELDPNHNKLVLKGGTAINLLYMNVPRLSVDIDLDYVGFVDKEKAKAERTVIMESLDNFMLKEGYHQSGKSRNSVILASRTYSYVNAFGNNDNIKVEINFIDRTHPFETVLVEADCFERKVLVCCPLKEELFGMKIAALIDRSKPRDLYDVNNIISLSNNLDLNKLRKSVLFYLSLDGVFFLDDDSFHGIESISQKEIKQELLPVLNKNERFKLDEIKEKVVLWLRGLLTLTADENRYLNDFSNGIYNPYLLFDDLEAERVLNHPMAKWRISLLQKDK